MTVRAARYYTKVIRHIYYGPGIVDIAPWASIFLWLFLRFKTIVPLIVINSVRVVPVTLDHKWRALGAVEVLRWFPLLLAAIGGWVERRPRPVLVDVDVGRSAPDPARRARCGLRPRRGAWRARVSGRPPDVTQAANRA